MLEKAEKNIDVLGLGLNQFREEHSEILKHKALEGITVRLLVVKPNSKISSIRSYQENDLRGETIEISLDKLEKYVKEINEIISKSKKGKKIQLKYYDVIPSTMIFRIDNIMFIGPYLHQVPSRNTITFKAEKNTKIFKQYIEHFDKLWHDKYTFD